MGSTPAARVRLMRRGVVVEVVALSPSDGSDPDRLEVTASAMRSTAGDLFTPRAAPAVVAEPVTI
ncbi:hypothetical protein [Mycolicibacterium komossense]|uniref:Uncharacterized protein n=1 Tax=Mycolicibacterium komossense TaxID=1779 RepID=A0ABT3CCG7_9MYCO|nr:hypothetical protein [Mycolicibacterium komossense]MCV7227136.1 hypothetical protein [Mycolicibacterium komossense]